MMITKIWDAKAQNVYVTSPFLLNGFLKKFENFVYDILEWTLKYKLSYNNIMQHFGSKDFYLFFGRCVSHN